MSEEKEQKRIHRAVRQILFNELGLKREGIREMIREIVEEAVAKYFKGEQFDKFLRDLANVKLKTWVGHVAKDAGTFTVGKVITEIIAEEVRKSVSVEAKILVEVGERKDEDQSITCTFCGSRNDIHTSRCHQCSTKLKRGDEDGS